MKARAVLVMTAAVVLATAGFAAAGSGPRSAAPTRGDLRKEGAASPKGFIPAAARAAKHGLSRYYVIMKTPSVAQVLTSSGTMAPSDQRAVYGNALRSQAGAIRDAKARGGRIVFRYGRLVNGFSVHISAAGAAALAARSDVASVQPVAIVQRLSNASTKFIGAPHVWAHGNRGQGMRVALVDTGIDYTHKDFGGPGTVEAYEDNDQQIIEPGTFPTRKVIGGYDFVGPNYDVLDDDPTNDFPVPDPDPLDSDGHGTHTGGTCCGLGISGVIQRGVAPQASIYAIKVWDEGNSTDDVLVAGYEFAVDPNQDGDTSDHADVLSFSGGVDYGTMNSVEAVAAQGVVDIGTVFVASAGNAGNQPSGGSAYITGTPANAPGVISVAADQDVFEATTITANAPPELVLPDGITVIQDWGSTGLDADLTTDLFDAREVDPPADPGNPGPGDAMLCDPVAPGSLDGKFALIFKGSTGDGDCDGSLKALNAQDAGASGILFWNGFGGLPFGLGAGCCGDQITVPVIMTSELDSEAIGAALSPNAGSGVFNEGTVNVTFGADEEPVPGFEDSMADFSSEGPARITSALKPDVTAPGVDTVSAGVGTGDGPATLSGTSMAAPHVSGTATLIREVHPDWSVAEVKAAIMNTATVDLQNNDLSTPVPATVMGAGRVRAAAAADTSTLAVPGSLSFGLQALASSASQTQSFVVENKSNASHHYTLTPSVRYTDFDPSIVDVQVSPSDFTVAGNGTQTVEVTLTVDPSAIDEALQEYGWYYFHPNVDGLVTIQADGGTKHQIHVSWHVAPLASAGTGLSETSLDVSQGPATMTVTGSGAGTSYADLYLLGGTGDTGTLGEEDIAAIGARSFTGTSIDGVAEGVPTGTDEFAGIGWQDFLTFTGAPTEPVEFGVQFYGNHNTTETLEVDVLVDAGADGVFADPGLQADYMIVKLPERPGTVCVYDLSLDNPFDACAVTYFPDYSNYNANALGIVVDASAIGLTDEAPEVSYKVEACTGKFSGDVPAQICDEVGGIGADGTYSARLNTTDPALQISHLVCGGFWDGGACDAGDPIEVSVGSAGAGETHPILAIFPNNDPATAVLTIVRVAT